MWLKALFVTVNLLDTGSTCYNLNHVDPRYAHELNPLIKSCGQYVTLQSITVPAQLWAINELEKHKHEKLARNLMLVSVGAKGVIVTYNIKFAIKYGE